MGMAHLDKARIFHREHNWSQALRHSDHAATKLKQLKDRPIVDISDALSYKCDAFGFLDRYKEQLECAKEWYCLWNTKPTDVDAIDAAFALIESCCIQNKEFADAHLYASTLYEIINHKHDNKIPEDQRQRYIARGAYYLASAILRFAQTQGIPPKEKQKAGQEAIAHACRALEIHIQLYGTEHNKVANDMSVLAELLDFFNDDGDYDDEVLRLHQQAIAIVTQAYGSSSLNVAIVERKLGYAYYARAKRANGAVVLVRYVANLELALPHHRESARIFRAIGRVEKADEAAQDFIDIEEQLQQVTIARAAAAAAVSRG